jgi:hypothetical protein
MLLTLEAEIGEESNILGSFFAPSQFSEDEKSLPATTAPDTNTLQPDSQIVEITFSNAAPPHDLPGAKVLEGEVDKGEDNADGKDPF